MRSSITDILPIHVRRSLRQFGADLSLARRKRGLTLDMMAERLAIAKSTYQRVEKGDSRVSFGIYAMALFVLGFGAPFLDIIEPKEDIHGLLLDSERVPKRVRRPRPKNHE